MTKDELKSLREKHAECSCGHCTSNECSAGCVGDYPCDVIKVLDEVDRVMSAAEVYGLYVKYATEINTLANHFCASHNEVEPLDNPFIVCPECWHVYETEEALVMAANVEYPRQTPYKLGDTIHACPFCNHDF